MVSQRTPETGDLDPGECVGVGSAAGEFSLLKTAGGHREVGAKTMEFAGVLSLNLRFIKGGEGA